MFSSFYDSLKLQCFRTHNFVCLFRCNCKAFYHGIAAQIKIQRKSTSFFLFSKFLKLLFFAISQKLDCFSDSGFENRTADYFLQSSIQKNMENSNIVLLLKLFTKINIHIYERKGLSFVIHIKPNVLAI